MNARPRSSLSLDGRERTAARIEAIDWSRVTHDLDAQGCAMLDGFLSAHECATLAALYSQHQLFRNRVVMGRHGLGRGEYQYFRYPLPQLVAELRAAIYPRLVPLANLWNEAMGWDVRYPAQPADFIERCHAAGQSRPTPLLLQYGPGDYNCLHQDVYGEHVFPLQMAILLSKPGCDFAEADSYLLSSGHSCSRDRKSCRLGKTMR